MRFVGRHVDTHFLRRSSSQCTVGFFSNRDLMNVFVTCLIYGLVRLLCMVYHFSLILHHVIFFLISVFIWLSIKLVSHCTRLILFVHLIKCLKHIRLMIQTATDHAVLASHPCVVVNHHHFFVILLLLLILLLLVVSLRLRHEMSQCIIADDLQHLQLSFVLESSCCMMQLVLIVVICVVL